METLKQGWDFFQEEVLGMAWLNLLIDTILNSLGLDVSGKIRDSNAVLFMFINSTVYWIYKYRITAWRYIFVFDFVVYG